MTNHLATPHTAEGTTFDWRDDLAVVQQLLPITRRVVRAGDSIYEGGECFDHLYLINSGQCKTVNFTADGRGQVVGLHFRGDWLGFDGIADQRYACDAIALDTGEVWSVRYSDLLAASASSPELMRLMHAAMSRQIGRGSDSPAVAGHPACGCPRRGLHPGLGPVARGAWSAHRPHHLAHDTCRDRQLPGHDARVREPRAATSGAMRRHPLRREGPARPDDPERRCARRLHSQCSGAGRQRPHARRSLTHRLSARACAARAAFLRASGAGARVRRTPRPYRPRRVACAAGWRGSR